MSSTIPNGWGVESLQTLIKHIIDFRGRTPKKLGLRWGGGNIRALSANNVQMGHVSFEKECYFASSELYEKWMTKGCTKKDDILFTMEAPLGNVALVPDNKKYILSQRVILIRPELKKADPHFLFQQLRSVGFQKQLVKNSTGSTALGIQQKRLIQLEVVIPPLSEQQKIATILCSVDKVIEKTRAQINKLKDLKTGMMQELFSKGVGHTEFKDSQVGCIPYKWEVAELKEYLTFISYGFTNPMPESNFGPLMVTAKDINFLKIHYETARMTTLKAYEKDLSDKSRPRLNDILLTKDGTLGRVAIVERENICINQSVAVLRPNDKVMPKFLLYLLASPLYQREMLDNSGGSTIKHIYITIVDKMKVAIPDENEQIKIVNILDSLHTKLSLCEKRLNSSIKIKKALMQDLLTGKVRVNVENHQEERMAV